MLKNYVRERLLNLKKALAAAELHLHACHMELEALFVTLDGVDKSELDTTTTHIAHGIAVAVAAQCEVSVDAMLGRSRKQHIVTARHISMKLSHENGLRKMSKSELGRLYGRNHTTIMDALISIDALIKNEESTRALYEACRAACQEHLLTKP